jgi:periplasmic divalent cation tolerance protein
MAKKATTKPPAEAPVRNATDVLQVITTVARKDEAESLAAELVSRQLAGCVQILGPITSIFHWQDKIEHSEEWLCQIKTQAAKYDELEAVIRQLHPYDVPEILALPAVHVSPSYAQWLADELARK